MNEELPEERFVRERFGELFGVELEKVASSRVKTFDYWLTSGGGREAAVEVKRFKDDPLPPWAYVHPGDIARTGHRELFAMLNEDKGPARVGRAIHEAAKQLRSCSTPRILVFVNDNMAMDFLDLEEAYTGELVYGESDVGRFRSVRSHKVAFGTIRDEKAEIDLFVWFNRSGGRTTWSRGDQPWQVDPGPFFRLPRERGHELTKRFFKGHHVPRPVSDPNEGVPTLYGLLLREAGII